MSDPAHKTLKLLHAFMDKFHYLHSYILSSYLFWLPWMFTWEESSRDYNGLVVQLSNLMVLFSPIALPFVMIMFPISFIAETVDTNIFIGIGMCCLFFLYYAFVLFVSYRIVRHIIRFLKKKVTYSQTTQQTQI